MKIAIAQLNYHVGNFEANTTNIISHIRKAQAEGAALVVFSELSICGYPPHDMLEFDWFISACEQHIQLVADACQGITAIVGAPLRNPHTHGKRLYNAAYVLADGQIKRTIKKTLLPTYDVFDEYRYFQPSEETDIITIDGVRIALTICEDLWSVGTHPLYTKRPMDQLIQSKPDLMINIAASPYSAGHIEERRQVLASNAIEYQLPLIYCNQIGAHTELLFDGSSLAMNKQGAVINQLATFGEDICYLDLQTLLGNNTAEETAVAQNHISHIYQALVLGIRDYFQKMGFKNAILGLSGGIDSALVAALATDALGKDNVWGILLPSQYSSDHSIADAEQLAKNLQIKYDLLPIASVYEAYESALESQFAGLPIGLAEENLQARIRGGLLMAMSNKFGHILLNTTNKSEMAVGYGTLYGDMCGGLSVLGDVYKTQVYALAHYINRNHDIIPQNTITKAPSAELRPDQKDSDSLPDYDTLDGILHQYIECRQSLTQIISAGYAPDTAQQVIRLVNMNEYKRYQAAPVLRVSGKAFRSGRRMPLVAKYSM